MTSLDKSLTIDLYRENANKSVSRIYFHYPENENDNIAITNKRNTTNDINVKINTIEINITDISLLFIIVR